MAKNKAVTALVKFTLKDVNHQARTGKPMMDHSKFNTKDRRATRDSVKSSLRPGLRVNATTGKLNARFTDSKQTYRLMKTPAGRAVIVGTATPAQEHQALRSLGGKRTPVTSAETKQSSGHYSAALSEPKNENTRRFLKQENQQRRNGTAAQLNVSGTRSAAGRSLRESVKRTSVKGTGGDEYNRDERGRFAPK